MQITVKSTKVLKTGTNKSGDWEFIGVTSDDGTDYTTFHKNAKNLAPGSVIDIGEPLIKEGKCSFKEYKVVSAPAPISGNGQPGMTPADWAEKDRLERWSRECNTCFMGIMELVKDQDKNQLAPKLKEVYDNALDWAKAHLATTQKPVPVATTSKSSVSLLDLVFPDAGKLKTACRDRLKMNLAQIEKETAGFDLATEKGRIQAWVQIVAVFGKKDEKDTTKKEESLDPDNLFGDGQPKT